MDSMRLIFEEKTDMRFISILLLVFLAFQLKAQYTITGKVTNAGQDLEFANVILSDSTGIIDSDITNISGGFSLQASAGSYDLEISFIGLSTWKKAIELEQDLEIDQIIMFENSAQLDQVTISARKRVIEQKSDRLVFNISNNISAQGRNGVDILKLAPGLVVRDGSISILGKGVSRVMVNGRLMHLEGQDLLDFVSGFSAEDISKIEIIANPPAQYEAAGTGGLVNIITKSGIMNSWKNTMNFSFNKNLYEHYSFSDNFLWNKNGIQLSASINGQLGSRWEFEGLSSSFPDQTWNLNMNSRNRVDQIAPKVITEYQLNDRLSIGFQYLGSFSRPNFESLAVTEVRNTNSTFDFDLNNERSNTRYRENQSVNAHTVYQLDTLGKQVSLDLDYFNYANNTTDQFNVDRLFTDGSFLERDLRAENLSTQNIINQSVKLDFTHPTTFANFSFGLKLSQISTANEIENFNLITGTPIFDTLLSNEFRYDETTSAAYFSGSKQVSSKFDLQLGLRLERTQSIGISKTLDQENANRYIKLFPSVFASYKHSDASQFSFSYGRRINRPGFRDLNPFRIYINSQSYSEGNPFLQPSFSDNFSLDYRYLGIFSTSLFLNYLSDGFGTVFSADPETQEQATVRLNFYENLSWGLSERIGHEPMKWWSAQHQLFFLRSDSRFVEILDGRVQNGFQFYASSNHDFKLNEQQRIQVNLWYSSPTRSNIFEVGDTYNFSLSWNYQILSKRMNLNVQFNDILNSASYDFIASEVNGVRSVYRQNYSSRHLNISLRYNFGNKKVNVRDRGFGNEEERGRSY